MVFKLWNNYLKSTNLKIGKQNWHILILFDLYSFSSYFPLKSNRRNYAFNNTNSCVADRDNDDKYQITPCWQAVLKQPLEL